MENESKMNGPKKSLMEFFRSRYFRRSVLMILAGGLAGFLFFYFVGCKSGTCPITSNPYNSIITGSLLGFLITKPDEISKK
jgi:presenilin-like A22 family membrane protease